MLLSRSVHTGGRMAFHKHIRGQRIETATAFFLRYYRTTGGQRKKVMVKLADKSDQYRCW